MSAFDRRLLDRTGTAYAFVVVTAGLGVLTAVLLVAQALLIADVVATTVDGGSVTALRPAVVALLGVVAARAVIAWSVQSTAHRASAAVTSQLRRSYLRQLVRLGPTWLESQRRSGLETLGTRGLSPLEEYVGRYLPHMVLAVVVPLVIVIAVGSRDLVAAAIIFTTLPLVPVFMAVVGATTKAKTAQRLSALQRLAGQFLDNTAGLSTLKIFGASSAGSKLRAATDDLRHETMRTLRLAFLSSLVLELTTSLSVALVAVAVGLRLVNGTLDFQTGLYVLILGPEAYQPLRALAAHYHEGAGGVAVAKQVHAVLDLPVRASRTVAVVPDLATDALAVENVTVRFPGQDVPALNDLSFRVMPGEVIALAGASGTGKTTALGVLLGLVTPETGRVRVGDWDLCELEPQTWRRLIAWVPQRPYLLARSMHDNIALGRPGAGRDLVEEAVAAAGLEATVNRLPDGLATVLGAGGHGLSAGERQRLALARAFLLDAPLVLLDEPTASLDGETEQAVLASLRTLAAGRTVVVAAHRYALLGVADRVVALDPAPAGRGAP